tara:strand:+ start:96 stop:392 length:297 start_codon:yes stop_codon:yes gene_type:complete
MNVESIIEYVAGYVSATGGKVELVTRDLSIAMAWTRSHARPGKLAVCKGLTLDDCNCEQQHRGYIAEHMNKNIIGYEGAYTNLYLNNVDCEDKLYEKL